MFVFGRISISSWCFYSSNVLDGYESAHWLWNAHWCLVLCIIEWRISVHMNTFQTEFDGSINKVTVEYYFLFFLFHSLRHFGSHWDVQWSLRIRIWLYSRGPRVPEYRDFLQMFQLCNLTLLNHSFRTKVIDNFYSIFNRWGIFWIQKNSSSGQTNIQIFTYEVRIRLNLRCILC